MSGADWTSRWKTAAFTVSCFAPRSRRSWPFHGTAYDHQTIKFNFYPDVNIHNVVSLRLFGSDHAKNKVFSRVLTPDRLLGEAASWDYFGDFLRNKAIPPARFTAGVQRAAGVALTRTCSNDSHRRAAKSFQRSNER